MRKPRFAPHGFARVARTREPLTQPTDTHDE